MLSRGPAMGTAGAASNNPQWLTFLSIMTGDRLAHGRIGGPPRPAAFGELPPGIGGQPAGSPGPFTSDPTFGAMVSQVPTSATTRNTNGAKRRGCRAKSTPPQPVGAAAGGADGEAEEGPDGNTSGLPRTPRKSAWAGTGRTTPRQSFSAPRLSLSNDLVSCNPLACVPSHVQHFQSLCQCL